ncbi:sorting nexin-19 isoform X2 [Microcaecilia unicolor]|uniref:Sorting nexin-19 isoform X2 n=1 Tax=Microcaecilia unicolor TaxID=1415580 RepID=A0A6P7ZMM9_9AMPH|nr:sorting nexin-19 isoform X2 [Microcaecilia unicolor]
MFRLNDCAQSMLLVFGELTRSKLLAISAVLLWLIVVHLLVNLWLLILLCTLLMALGVWLGLQIVMSTSNQIHLERFVSLESLPQNPDAQQHLENEISQTIQKIIRDFVLSWYRSLSCEPRLEDEVRGALSRMAAELKRRVQLVNQGTLIQKVLVLVGCHLQSYMKAKEIVDGLDSSALSSDLTVRADQLWKDYSKFFPPHVAVQSTAMELKYTRGITNLLLSILVPKPHLETPIGKCVMVELITCNVLLPLINRMSEPDWINLIVTDIFSKSAFNVEEKDKERVEVPPLQPPVPCSLPLKVHIEVMPDIVLYTPTAFDLSSYDVVDSFEYEHQETEEETKHSHFSDDPATRTQKSMHHLHPNAESPLFFCEDSEPESPMSDLGKEMDPLVGLAPEELLTDCFQDSVTYTDVPMIPDEEGDGEADIMTRDGISAFGSLLSTPVTVPNSGPEILNNPKVLKEDTNLISAIPAPHDETGNISPKPPSSIEKEPLHLEGLMQSQLETAPAAPILSSSPTVPMDAFIFQPLSSPDGPVVIQNLRITGTITAREHSGTGSHPYTLYTVKYETALDSENLGSLQPLAYHTVNRRYREFLNLQTRLEEKPDFRKFIKHIKGPRKLFPDLPFGNMDSEKVEARKSLLESFLKQVCVVPEIANSEEVQEFLALNTDARIAFVKKPFPRLDKMVVNAIVDTLKTAFPRSEPQSPTEDLSEAEVDGKHQTEGKKSKSRLRFPSSKIAPALNSNGMQEKIRYCLRENNVSDKLPLAGIESFIDEQERWLGIQLEEDPEREETDELEAHEKNLDSNLMDVHQKNVEPDIYSGSETAQADAALDILWLLMKDRWSWLCTENMQKAIHLLFGTLIQRWMEVQITNLTCPQRWVIYLRLLQQAVWPGGALRSVPRPVRTQEQKKAAREEALQSLMRILPGIWFIAYRTSC